MASNTYHESILNVTLYILSSGFEDLIVLQRTGQASSSKAPIPAHAQEEVEVHLSSILMLCGCVSKKLALLEVVLRDWSCELINPFVPYGPFLYP